MPDTAGAILDDMVTSAIRQQSARLRRAVTRGNVLQGVEAKTFHRARATGWLGPVDFAYILEQCEVSQQPIFHARWAAFHEQRAHDRLEERRLRAVRRMSIAELLRPDAGDAAYWSSLANGLIYRGESVTWPMRPEEISHPLDALVEKGRQLIGEEHALKNALVLMRAALVRNQTDKAAERLMLLSIIVAAVKVAGLLGHRAAQRGLSKVLAALHNQYPSDVNVERVWLCARGLTTFHATGQRPSTVRQALLFHSREAELAERSIRDRSFARDWPVIYREVRGPAWNLMNVRVDAGLPMSLTGHFFRRHIEWQAITEEHLPTGFRLAENPRLAVETAAYDVRFRAGVLLDRADGNGSFASAHADQALFEIDEVLGSAAIKTQLNELTIGPLLGLRAETLLCLYARQPTETRRDEYADCKDSAVAAYATARDQANSLTWAARLRSLEHAAGLPATSGSQG